MTVKNDEDFSAKTDEERSIALTQIEQSCIDRLVQGILAAKLIHFDVVETENHGYKATATLGVYDIRELFHVPEEKDAKARRGKKKPIRS